MRGNDREEKLNAMLESYRIENEKANAKDSGYQKRLAEFERLNSRNKTYYTSGRQEYGSKNKFLQTSEFKNTRDRNNEAYNDLMTAIRVHQEEANKKDTGFGQRKTEFEKLNSRNKSFSGKDDSFSMRRVSSYQTDRSSSFNDVMDAVKAKGYTIDTEDEGYKKRLAEFEKYNSGNALFSLERNDGLPSRMRVSHGGSGIKAGMRSPARNILSVSMFFIMGLIFLFFGIKSSNDQRRLRKACTQTVTAQKTGEEWGVNYHSKGENTTYCDHIYTYTYNGRTYTAKWKIIPKNDDTQPPDEMSLYIDPNIPDKYYIPQKKTYGSQNYVFAALFTGVGIVVVVINKSRGEL